MAFIAISGEPGCRHEELARRVARRLECELVTESVLETAITNQFGSAGGVPYGAWQAAAAAILIDLATERAHLVACCPGAERLAGGLPLAFRVHVVAPESVRVRNLMTDAQIGRPAAKARLVRMAAAQSELRKRRFGQKTCPATSFDLLVNEQGTGMAEVAGLVVSALASRGLLDSDPLSAATAAEARFQAGLRLARYGLGRLMDTPGQPGEEGGLERKTFGHPSEQVFANLLDFYRIAWDYEPRSFPLQWDKDGKVSEAFTPDFYLPEFDLYVELTTMKQSNVTRKNRKIRLLRAIYPHVNIQVFYQKDVQDLVMKYRSPERAAH
jgi:hypothetical protein